MKKQRKTPEDWKQIAQFINELVENGQVSSVLELGQHLAAAGYVVSMKKPTMYAFVDRLKKKGIINSEYIRATGDYILSVNREWLNGDITQKIVEKKKEEEISKLKFDSIEDLIQEVKNRTLDRDVVLLLEKHLDQFIKYETLYKALKTSHENLLASLDTEIDKINLQIEENNLELNKVSLKQILDIVDVL